MNYLNNQLKKYMSAFGIVIALCTFLTSNFNQSAHAQEPVQFKQCPVDKQLYPRDKNNETKVVFSGTVTDNNYQKILINVTLDEKHYSESTQNLTFDLSHKAQFYFSIKIDSGLHEYDFTVTLVTADNTTKTVAEIKDIVAGDVFLLQGQSNTVAADYHQEGLANQSQSKWIRSFGNATTDPEAAKVDLNWYMADGLGYNIKGTVGAWGLRMAEILVTTYDVPIAIINGSVGGTQINYHMRNDENPTDLNTNYGRLLYRTQQCQLQQYAKAILWYQGESNGTTGVSDYYQNFVKLYNDWNKDYTSLEKIYIFQIRDGCGEPVIELRDLLRRLADIFPDKIEVMSTTAAPQHDGCHYFYAGYRELGDRIARLVARDFYDSPDTINITAPNPQLAMFTDPNKKDEILLIFSQPKDTMVWAEGAEKYFKLIGGDGSAKVNSGEVIKGNSLLLKLNSPTNATAISYITIRGNDPVITNEQGVGMLDFYAVPIM